MYANRWCETCIPQVGEAIDWLSQYAAAKMSGTGACVFAAIDSLAQAEVVKSRVPKQWNAYITRAMNCNPVHQQLGLLVDKENFWAVAKW